MEDTNSPSKEVTTQGSPVYYSWCFHKVIRPILRCLGLETESHFQQNPNKKEDDDGKVLKNIIIQATCQQEAADSHSSTTEYSDPKSTITHPATDPPSISGDSGVAVSLAAPPRPGTSSGRGPQIN